MIPKNLCTSHTLVGLLIDLTDFTLDNMGHYPIFTYPETKVIGFCAPYLIYQIFLYVSPLELDLC